MRYTEGWWSIVSQTFNSTASVSAKINSAYLKENHGFHFLFKASAIDRTTQKEMGSNEKPSETITTRSNAGRKEYRSIETLSCLCPENEFIH